MVALVHADGGPAGSPGRRLWLGQDVAVKAPRTRAHCGRTYYATAEVTDGELLALLAPGDVAYAARPGHPSVLRMQCAGGRYWIARAAGWGVDGTDPAAVAARLETVRAACADADLPFLRSASGTARKLCQEYGVADSLPPRWRGLATAAVHGGPALCVAGGGGPYGPEVVCLDLRRAYWHALAGPLPVARTYRPVAGAWDRIRPHDGVVEATVDVPGPFGPGGVPPLPVRGPRGGVVYGRGVQRGVWTVAHLRAAEDWYGARVVTVHQGALATHDPWLAVVMERVAAADKVVAKPVYTRMYGAFGAPGGYEGRRPAEPTASNPTADLEWVSRAVSPMGPGRPMYRPDVAAAVTGWCHVEVFRALARLRRELTIAVHVDAVWTADVAGALALAEGDERWDVRRRGRVWYLAPGQYVHWRGEDGVPECAAAGWTSPEPPSLPGLRALASNAGPVEVDSRRWVAGRLPWDDPGATSVPVDAPAASGRTVVAHPDVRDARWLPDGRWDASRARAVVEVPPEPLPLPPPPLPVVPGWRKPVTGPVCLACHRDVPGRRFLRMRFNPKHPGEAAVPLPCQRCGTLTVWGWLTYRAPKRGV